jgi:hypothetical protein
MTRRCSRRRGRRAPCRPFTLFECTDDEDRRATRRKRCAQLSALVAGRPFRSASAGCLASKTTGLSHQWIEIAQPAHCDRGSRYRRRAGKWWRAKQLSPLAGMCLTLRRDTGSSIEAVMVWARPCDRAVSLLPSLEARKSLRHSTAACARPAVRRCADRRGPAREGESIG